MLKIYGIPRSRTMRCLWMLEELGIQYENVPVHYVGDAQKPEYLRLNPNGRIPTLDDDGVVVWESMAINLYLAKMYGRDLGPRGDAEEAHALQWSFWAMTEVEPLVMMAFGHRAFLPEEQRVVAKADEAEASLARPFKVLDGHLAERSYLIADRFTVADLNVASVMSWAQHLARCDLGPYANVTRWLGQCLARSAFQRSVPSE